MGVGDEVTFGTGAKVYLMRKSSATQWRVTSAEGKWPDGVSNEPVISIKRAFNSLNAAMNGTSPLAGDATHLNGKNLTSKDTKLYIACYGDGEDATGVSIPSGTWTVDATRYITICTPANISTECNTSQRHPGKWTTGKYVLSSSSGGTLYTYPNYTVIDGLQLSNSTTTSYNVTGYAYGSYYTIKNCIIKGGLAGYYIGGWSNYVTVCNNIVYDCYGDGIWLNGDASDGYHKAYNNTVYHCNIAEANYYDGIKVCGLGSLSTNNISMNNHSGTSYKRDFVVAFDAAQSYNISSDATASGTGSLASRTATANPSPGAGNWVVFTNITAGYEDFHLQNVSENDANNAGVGPGSDANVPETDIDGDARSGTTADIGADEFYSTLSLSNHPAGQVISAFTYQGAETNAGVFAFRLTPGGLISSQISQMVFSLTNINNLTDGEWAGVELCVDTDGDGSIEAGETSTVGGAGAINTTAKTISFSTGFSVSGATNYIMRADFSNLDPSDRVTIMLDTGGITTTSTKSGSVDSITHWEVPWFNPGKPLPKQYTTVSGNDIYVQTIGAGATTSSYFSSRPDSLRQFFIDFNASNSTTDGLLNSFKSASSDPGSQVSAAFELLPSDKSQSNLFNIYRKNGANESWYSSSVTALSFTVVESTFTRTKYRINQRTVPMSGNNATVTTEFTVYPSGHIFVYDSAYVAADDDTISAQFYVAQNSGEGAILAQNNSGKAYGGLYGTGTAADNLHDFVAGFLGYRDKNGTSETPFASCYAATGAGNRGVTITGTRTAWNSGVSPYQQAFMADFSTDNVASSELDNFMLDKQDPHVFDKYDYRKGWYDTDKKGDLNGDGFNESDGTYELHCIANQVYFWFNHHANRRKRYCPVFRMNNYTNVSVPTCVFLQHVSDATIIDTLMPGNGEVNISLNDASDYVVFQINRIIRDSVLIFCGDPASGLAVEMSGFWGYGDNGAAKLTWTTQSESDNLGFNLYRREVKDEVEVKDKTKTASTLTSALASTPYRLIADYTVLKGQLTRALRTDYEFTDEFVSLGKTYEYKLESVDLYYLAEAYKNTVVLAVDKVFPFDLEQNVPNPFNPLTRICYSVPGRFSEGKKLFVRLEIYNIRGQLVRNLVTDNKAPNRYSVVWNCKANNGRYVASGVYVYRISIGDEYLKMRKMIVVK